MPRLDSTIDVGPFRFTECLYDVENDVVCLSIGAPREAITLESPEGHLLRLDPDTDELMGVTFLHLKERIEAEALTITFPECVLPTSGKMPLACTSVKVPQRVLAPCCL